MLILNRIVLSFFLIFLFLLNTLYSKEIILEHTDSLKTEYNPVDSNLITYLMGHVRIRQDNIVLISNFLKYEKKSDFFFLKDSVRIIKYDKMGKVVVDYFEADSMLYYKQKRLIKAKGNIFGYIEDTTMILKSDSIEYDLNKEIGYIWKNPKVIFIDKDSFFLMGKEIFINKKNSYIEVYDSSTFYDKDLRTYSDTIRYYLKGDSIYFKGSNSPYILTPTDSITSKFIIGYFNRKTRTLDSLKLFKNVYVNSKNDSLIYILTGDFMRINFKNSNINNVLIIGEIKGNYKRIKRDSLIEYGDFFGDTLNISLLDSNIIKNIIIKKNVVYYLYTNENIDKKNYFKGEEAFIDFENNNINILKVYVQAELGIYKIEKKVEWLNIVTCDSFFVKFKESKPIKMNLEGAIEGKIIKIKRN